MKNATTEPKKTRPAAPFGPGAVESYQAPPPPVDGKIIGVDCHPDTFTAAVFVGQTPHDARQLGRRDRLSLEGLLAWAAQEFGPQDLFLLEAGSNSFEVCGRLRALGRRAIVLESGHVGRHAKTYADNDRLAAARIARVYLAGGAPCVWVPDAQTRERREVLHAYRKAVGDHTAAENSLKGYLTTLGIRPGSRNLAAEKTRVWVLRQYAWTDLQRQLLEDYCTVLAESAQRRQRLTRLIAQELSREPLMLRCLKLLGIGPINAFALLAVIGDVRRFERPEKLVAYIGLNPGQRESGDGKHVKIGIGKRGRSDVRHLLIQGAHAILRQGKATVLGQWGWKLFARKGSRNVAVAAVARKLVVQVWHLLSGNPPTLLEAHQSFTLKLQKLAVTLGKALREKLGLGTSLAACIQALRACAQQLASAIPCATPEPV